MSSGSYLLNHDNMRGLIVSQRPAEVLAMKSTKINPFVSRVTNKDALGLPPIGNTITFFRRNECNLVDLKNKEIVKKIQGLKKLESNIVQDEEIYKKIKAEKIKSKAIKQNIYLNRIKKEIYGDDVMTGGKSINFRSSSEYALKKINAESDAHNNIDEDIYTKSHSETYLPELNNVNNKFNTIDAFDENQDEMNDLLKFVNNLNYDKYMRDLEIREALHLIKNKILKDNEENKENSENKIDENLTIKADDAIVKPNDEIINQEIIKKHKFIIPIEHDNEWNTSVKPVNENIGGNDEVAKKTIVDKILKNDKNLRSIHSYQSIKKLLEREGLTPAHLNNVKIAVCKEREIIQNYEYKPSLMCGLRDLPLI